MQIRKALFLCGVLGTINCVFGCQLSEFMCDTGYCVALDKFCNGNDDCGDKSDEPPYCSREFFFLILSLFIKPTIRERIEMFTFESTDDDDDDDERLESALLAILLIFIIDNQTDYCNFRTVFNLVTESFFFQRPDSQNAN